MKKPKKIKKPSIIGTFPYPRKQLKNQKEVERYYTQLVGNILEGWLDIVGYSWWILLPGEDGFVADTSATACITVQYPYKKFAISIQQTTVNDALKSKPRAAFWRNNERSMLHECLHVLFAPLSEVARKRYTTPSELSDAEETAVDHLSVCIHQLMQDLRKKK